MADRVLHIAAEDGAYRARLNGGTATAERTGLAGMGRVRSIEADARDPSRVYAATNEGGFWRSDDGGGTWRAINRHIVYLEAWSLAQDRSSGVLYGGTGPASIYRSDDQGESWEDLRGFKTMPEMADWTFPMAPFVPHVKHLSVSPNDPAIIMGAIEEGWLVRTTDGGRSWRNLKNGTEFDAHTVLCLADTRQVVMTSGKGVMRSDDGGETFAIANDGISRKYLAHVAYHPDRAERLFTAGAEGYPGLWRKRPEGALSEFYRSLDAGRSWARLTGGVPDTLHAAARATAVAPDDPDTMFVGLTDGTIWGTTDGGDHFSKVAEGAAAIFDLAVLPR